NAQHKVTEDCYGDNTIWTGLRISGNNVQEIPPPYIPEDRIPFNPANVSAIQAGGRWKVAEGNHWMLDTGTSQGEAQRAVEIIKHYGLASMCFVGRPRCGDVTPMMYWLTAAGRAPSGSLPGEDVIGFDRANLEVKQVGDRWKVVEGTHWLLDFGPGQGNAIAALHFIWNHRPGGRTRGAGSARGARRRRRRRDRTLRRAADGGGVCGRQGSGEGLSGRGPAPDRERSVDRRPNRPRHGGIGRRRGNPELRPHADPAGEKACEPDES